ncbi:condensation domain-containing protein, partial [Streptomyces sp. UNOC14_S4]|uniref:condensation domain-containing protein n=1 Tax=Streptomyces sp. UNOC14_S4 TaxID=2872340 RepID=UPI001E2A00E2
MTPPRIFPLTSYQRDIWAAESHAPGDHQFNVVVHERLDGRADLNALRLCLTGVLRRNEAFSLRFDELDGVPGQWVEAPEADTDAAEWVAYLDFSGEADPAAACAAWRDAAYTRPFPLRRGRLFTAAVLRESDDVAHLFLNAHHIVADAWAVNQVSLQTWAEYARVTGGAPETPDAPAL